MTTAKTLLTSRQLAEKAGIDHRVLRRIIRKYFKGAAKTQVEGKRSEYRFDPNDQTTKDILAKLKELKPKGQAKAKKPKKMSKDKKITVRLAQKGR